MVLTPRIELRFPPYQRGVLPLYYASTKLLELCGGVEPPTADYETAVMPV